VAGKFVIAKEIEVKVDVFGTSSRLSDPPSTDAKQLTVIDVNFDPGKGHNFHKHADQEEVVLVIAGRIEGVQLGLCHLRSTLPRSLWHTREIQTRQWNSN
jgi:hypothetical protein